MTSCIDLTLNDIEILIGPDVYKAGKHGVDLWVRIDGVGEWITYYY